MFFFGEVFIFIKILLSGIPVLQPGTQTGGLPFVIWIPSVDYNPQSYTNTYIIYKELAHDFDLVTHFGAWDHLENTKFKNWRPIRDYRAYTIEDAINKRIGIHFGSSITIT